MILRSIDSPFLHLRCGDVDAVSLAPTAHGEVNVELAEALALIALGNDIENIGVIQDVVVEGEVAASAHARLGAIEAMNNVTETYLGTKSTPLALTVSQFVFLTSATAFWSSSAVILPAQ